jgi:hypothetical protein
MPESLFTRVDRCWVCESAELSAAVESRHDFANLKADHDLWLVLRDYHGHKFMLNKCRRCGFPQPSVLPSHPDYFGTIYSMKWSTAWMEDEFES